MSSKRERQRRRAERARAEGEANAADRRGRLLQLAAGAAFLAIAAVVALIVVNAASNNGSGDTELEDVAAANRLFKGIPQARMVLGDPRTPVELVEYGDLQCPVCKAFSEEILPPIIENQVKNGGVSLTFRSYVIIGAESVPAGAAMLAAGEQGRGWNFLEIFYRNQGRERSGYVTEEFIEAVGRAAGIRDFAKWNRERKSKALEDEVDATTQEAQELGFTGTPSFAIKGPKTNGLEALGTPQSTDALEEAIEAAS
jgi:protein-disulfide isomerase